MRRLKIGVLASNLLPIPPKPKDIPPQWSGAPEKIISIITEGLVERGHEVTLFASGNSRTRAKLVNITDKNNFANEELKKFGERFWVHSAFYDLLLCSKAYQMAKEGKLDVIHYHFYNFLGGIFFAPFIKTPTICTLHDFLGGTRKKILENFKNALYYVSISNSQRKPIPDLNYVKTVYHGIDTKKIPFGKKSKDYLVFVGRIHPDKGVKEAIEVAKKIKKRIIILGSHAENEYWQKEIKPEIDNREIIYKGFLPERKMYEILKNALAFLFPLQWEEPFGLVLIESMATGTPVIAFNRGSVPEIVKDGKTGFIVPCFNKKGRKNIEGLIEAVKKIGQIKREDCREWVEKNFSIEKMISDYEKIYYNLL